MINKKENKKMILVFIVALILDQITKIISVVNGYNYIPSEVNSEYNGYYIVLSIIVIALIIRYLLSDNTYIKTATKAILCLAIAGITGNMIDRIWNKNVILFINFGNDLVFNLAYFYIIIAWIGMAVLLTKNTAEILSSRKKQKEMQVEYEKNKEQINKEFKNRNEGNNIINKNERVEKNNNKSHGKKNKKVKKGKNGKKKHNNK